MRGRRSILLSSRTGAVEEGLMQDVAHADSLTNASSPRILFLELRSIHRTSSLFSVDLDPDPLNHISTQKLAHNSASVKTHDNRDGPLLPLPIPVKRDGHRAQPRADDCAQAHAVDLIQGQLQAGGLHPYSHIQTVDVEELRRDEEAEVDGDENRVGLVGRQRCAEEDYQDEDRRDGEGDGQDEGKEGRLEDWSISVILSRLVNHSKGILTTALAPKSWVDLAGFFPHLFFGGGGAWPVDGRHRKQ